MKVVITVPLPGDLPTNWQLAQTVAPSGEDVGLTRQHGYNYLMEMVNNAHQAILELANSGGGFELMETSIPPQERLQGTLYGLILHDWRDE